MPFRGDVSTAQAQEELKYAEVKYLECALAESDNKHREEVEAVRAQLEMEVEGGESSEREGSLIPRLSPQLSPQLSPRSQRELRLQ